MNTTLTLTKIHISREGNEVVRDLSLTVTAGEIHALMGPNGSGKSSLANGIMGHPKYHLTGDIILGDENITALPPNEKAKRGLFLSLQNPPEIGGVSVMNFLRAAMNSTRAQQINVIDFHKLLKKTMADMHLDPSFANRPLNEGFSGGEKKRMEMLQLRLLASKFAILDETDAGLDVDALQVMTQTISDLRQQGTGFLIITHHTTLFDTIQPERVTILTQGNVVAQGNKELIAQIAKNGYEQFT